MQDYIFQFAVTRGLQNIECQAHQAKKSSVLKVQFLVQTSELVRISGTAIGWTTLEWSDWNSFPIWQWWDFLWSNFLTHFMQLFHFYNLLRVCKWNLNVNRAYKFLPYKLSFKSNHILKFEDKILIDNILSIRIYFYEPFVSNL